MLETSPKTPSQGSNNQEEILESQDQGERGVAGNSNPMSSGFPMTYCSNKFHLYRWDGQHDYVEGNPYWTLIFHLATKALFLGYMSKYAWRYRRRGLKRVESFGDSNTANGEVWSQLDSCQNMFVNFIINIEFFFLQSLSVQNLLGCWNEPL